MDNCFNHGNSAVDPRHTQVIYVSGGTPSRSSVGPDQDRGFLRGWVFVRALRRRKALIYRGLCATIIASCVVYILKSGQVDAWMLGVSTTVTVGAVSTIVQFTEHYFRSD
jgi:hypothetical protein